MNCKNCGQPLEEGQELCPACGAAQAEAEVILEQAPVEELPEEVTQEVTEETPEETPEESEDTPAETVSEEETEIPAEETPAEAPAAPKRKLLLRVLALVCCVALALALGLGVWTGINGGLKPRKNDIQRLDNYTEEGDKLLKAMDQVVATVGDAKLTNRQLQIYYWNEVYNFLQEYGNYLSYMGIDLATPLSQQYVSEGDISYQQYFLENALSNWHSYQVLAIMGEAAGHVLSEEFTAQLADMKESLAATATYYGFNSVEELIQSDMGPGATEESYQEYLALYFYAMEYFDNIYMDVESTPEELSAYYDANAAAIEAQFAQYKVNKTSGPLVDVRHILVMPKGGTKDEQGQTTYSEEEWETCRQEAEAILQEWKDGLADEAFFAELAGERTEDPGSQSTGGLYSMVYQGQMVPEFNDWCFDESRQSGDTGLVRTSYGYHVMYFVYGEEGWIRAAEQSYAADVCSKMLKEGLEANPMEVDYKKIRLGRTEEVS